MILESDLLKHRIVKVLPHVIDSLLLISAISLTVFLGQYPFVNDWLTVKLLALITYIILGSIALKRGKTKKLRITALAASLMTFGYIVSIAYFHHPLGLLSRL